MPDTKLVLCLILSHREYIKSSPERLECERCGRWRVVHQSKPRNQGNGWSDGVYWGADDE